MIPNLARLSRGMLERRWITGLLALLILAVSLFVGWHWEQREARAEVRQASAQVRILAGSLTGALAFDDMSIAREYINALRLNDQILAAGVYRADGELVTGFAAKGETLPTQVYAAREAQATLNGRLTVVEPVQQGNLELGRVYLRTSVEPIEARLSRYFAVGAIVFLAAALIAILGATNAATAAANRELQEQIVARERAETALRQSQKLEALGQLTGGVAHDFNNLLMAALSGLELLDRAKSDERRDKLKASIREALDRGARITEQLLAFSRRRPLQTEVVRFQDRIAGLAELLDHSLRENIAVDFSVPADLWPIEVDRSQFEVALLNLAINAKDAMPKGGKLCISARNLTSALEGRDAVEISVEDDGVGMTAETVTQVFEPFFTTKEVGRGTGLGLSQVYGFAKAVGGSVAIESEPGAGTTIRLLLPRCFSASAATDVDSASSEQDPFEGLTILLVEDDPNLNVLLSEMLEELGARVVAAQSAAEGIELFAKAPADVVLSDMVMPGNVDGLAFARVLRKQKRALPVVLMTGYSEAAGAAVEEGFSVMRKPFTIESLAASIRSALGESRVRN